MATDTAFTVVISLLFFQNLGFPYARYLLATAVLVIAVWQNRGILRFNPFYAAIFVSLSGYLLLVFSVNASPNLAFDVFATTIYQGLTLLALFNLNLRHDFELRVAIGLLLLSIVLLFFASNMQPNEFVKQYNLSGNDNRFAANVIAIWLVVAILFKSKTLFLSLTFFLGVVFYLTDIRGGMFLLIGLLPVIYFWQKDKREFFLVTVLAFIFFNIIYFALIFVDLQDQSLSVRKELALYVLLNPPLPAFSMQAFIEPHSSLLSLYQIFGLLLLPLAIFLHSLAARAYWILSMIIISFVSEPFVMPYLLFGYGLYRCTLLNYNRHIRTCT